LFTNASVLYLLIKKQSIHQKFLKVPVKTIQHIAAFTCIVPAFVGLRYYKSLSKDLKAMTLFIILCFLMELPSTYLGMHKMNNLFILHFLTVAEILFLAYVYSFHIDKIISKKLLWCITTAFVMFSICNTLFIQPYYTFNSYARCIEILLVLFMAICYVYTLIDNDEQRMLQNIPMFWINTAVLIYFTNGFFLYLLANNTLDLPLIVRRSLRLFWQIHGILLSGFYFAVARAIWVQAKRQTVI
jgi:hypothetical protein